MYKVWKCKTNQNGKGQFHSIEYCLRNEFWFLSYILKRKIRKTDLSQVYLPMIPFMFTGF